MPSSQPLGCRADGAGRRLCGSPRGGSQAVPCGPQLPGGPCTTHLPWQPAGSRRSGRAASDWRPSATQATASVDAVVAFGGLADAGGRAKEYLTEVARVLRPGAPFIFFDRVLGEGAAAAVQPIVGSIFNRIGALLCSPRHCSAACLLLTGRPYLRKCILCAFYSSMIRCENARHQVHLPAQMSRLCSSCASPVSWST